MRKLLCSSLGLLLMITWGCAKRQYPAPPTHVCKRTVDSIKIDGKLNERSWQLAKTLTLTLREGTADPKYPTTLKVLWDDDMLYVGFTCVDPDMWATMTKRDDRLWEQEVVEVFLDPNRTGDPYFEFEVNPLNVVVDLRLMAGLKGLIQRGVTWNCEGLKTAVMVRGKVRSWDVGPDKEGLWVVEIGIPFKGLDSLPHTPPQDGDSWRANFYRIERPAALDKEDDEFSCWSPLYYAKSYHTLERFGTLIFSKKPVGK